MKANYLHIKGFLAGSLRSMFVLLILLLPFAGWAQKSPVDKLFEKYANKQGFTTVNISGALLGLAYQADANSPEGKMLSKLQGVRILSVDDEKLNKSLNFYQELKDDGFFKNNHYDVLMDVTDDDGVVRFYGKSAGNGKFSELLLLVGGDDNALISIRGIIDPENIAKMTSALNIDVYSGKSEK